MNNLVLSASSVSAYLRCHHACANDTRIDCMKPKPLSDLFWKHVDKSGECWLWTASLSRAGYGRMNRGGSSVLAHRLSWELSFGKIPEGMLVSNTCRTRTCVRPDHLRLLTLSERGHEAAHIPDRDAKFPWSRVAMPDGCWEWTGSLNSGGYGTVGRQGLTGRTLHRLAWEMAYGPIPDGAQVLHRCDNRKCCRPDHLFLGTAADNIYDMIEKGRAAWQRTSS